MVTDGFALYKQYLSRRQNRDLTEDKLDVLRDFEEEIVNNPAYQNNAKRNGKSQPLAVKRKNTFTCEFTVMPGDEMYIGDLVEVLGEKWLVTELRSDEYGMLYGECWMCNICLYFQNGTPEIITRYAILDNGSYTDTTGKPVSTADANFICYMSKDEATAKLYVDKRLALDKITDRDGNVILTAGRISWIDGKSENYGEGSHLLKFRLDNDIFNPGKDSVEYMICDYISGKTSAAEGNENQDTALQNNVGGEPVELVISGSDTLRIGSTRTYRAVCATDTDKTPSLIWSASLAAVEVIPSDDGYSCAVRVPLDGAYIGVNLEITCTDLNGIYKNCTKKVVVIANG